MHDASTAQPASPVAHPDGAFRRWFRAALAIKAFDGAAETIGGTALQREFEQ